MALFHFFQSLRESIGLELFTMVLVISSAGSLSIQCVYAQELKRVDYVYDDNVKSVVVSPVRSDASGFPFLKMGGGEVLNIAFDMVGYDQPQLTYRIEHCNRDWEPSGLNYNDYIDGFDEQYLNPNYFSAAARSEYTNYLIRLPNRDVRFLLSGNYLIHVFDNGVPILTRRFVVYESLVAADVRLDRSFDYRNRQTLRLQYNYNQDIDIRNPQSDISVTAIQNGRWDNAIYDIRPLFASAGRITFAQGDEVSFESGKEFRTLDIRTVYSRGTGIASIEQFRDGFEVRKVKDLPRKNRDIAFLKPDHDGQFILTNMDNLAGMSQSEYVDVILSLEDSDDLPNQPIYVVGAFNNWTCSDQYRLKLDAISNVHTSYFRLRQGLYDYAYAIKDDAGRTDISAISGNWSDAGNTYHTIMYVKTYYPVTYDRVVNVWIGGH